MYATLWRRHGIIIRLSAGKAVAVDPFAGASTLFSFSPRPTRTRGVPLSSAIPFVATGYAKIRRFS